MHIHHEVHGDGPPIVLVHGWGADSQRNWVETGWVEALRPARQVVTLDVRGHGRSAKPLDREAYRYRALSEDVLTVMDARGIERADLLGYSMGAFMAVALLGHHRERFTSVVMGGIGDETAESAAMGALIAAALRAEDPEAIEDPTAWFYRAYAESVPGNDLEALAVSAEAMWPDGHPLEVGGPGLADVDIPVLIVNGADDHPYVDSAGRLAAAIPGARAIAIPDTDHVTLVVDARFKAAVLDFLASV